MPTEVIVALIGFLGVIVGAVPTYWFMRQKNLAEVEKLKAETDKIKVEAEKIRRELQSDKGLSENSKIKILFVAVNPVQTARLSLDKEIRNIKQGLQKSSYGNMFELDQLWSANWNDLRSHLLRHTPDILHISGHSTKEGIVLEDEKGQTYIVPVEILNNLLALFCEKIRLVVINSAHSEEMSQTLLQNIDFTIGVSGPVSDDQANKFFAAFYEALANNEDIRESFEFAKARIDDKEFSIHGTYQLSWQRKRPEKYCFVQG
jgi:hypothetical protein